MHLKRWKGEIENMITICYDEELYKKKEAEYHEEIGEKRGAKQANLKIALWMKQKGMTKEEIMEAAELDLEEVDDIKKD